MSYTIESEKACFVVKPTDRKRFGVLTDHYDLTIFAIKSCSNNIEPRRPRWEALVASTVSTWNARPMFPELIWGLARDADGGGIKPGGRDCSGTAYIKQWQAAWEARVPYEMRPVLGTASLWLRDEDCLPYGMQKLDWTQIDALPEDSDRWSRYKFTRPDMKRAFDGLKGAGTQSMYPNRRYPISYGSAEFEHALFLFMNREYLPFSINLCE